MSHDPDYYCCENCRDWFTLHFLLGANMTVEKIERFTKTQLKERGWTESAIKKFLGNCDNSYPSPYSKKIKVQLWNCDRVIETEESKEFKDWYDKSKNKRGKQSELMLSKMEIKRNELLEYINNLNIEVPVIPFDELILLACQHYNDFKSARLLNKSQYRPLEKNEKATPNSGTDFLYRICGNFIRHQMTDYEIELSNIFGAVGKQEGYALLKDRVMSEINEKYKGLWQFIDEQKTSEE